eukprot:NODE_6698_length_508_cov_14.561680_g6532_i0.p2 GENE.NODE_6698_length_508_cov_14.561680_g6532_i0~~NODE_6698_length_508_cov_14.561680_g6532_i0.p2  ORF type:complete len:142 (+),score=45.37 NODE_6698_length_508_cov_14.561680_g6532_i0:58-426(+)
MAMVDVSGDGGILKKVLQEGSGPQAKAGQAIAAHYTGRLESEQGQIFDCTHTKPHRKDTGFPFQLGAGKVIRGWDLGFATMKVGEKAVLYIKAPYAYGEQGIPGTIPPNATLVFEVELLSAQ